MRNATLSVLALALLGLWPTSALGAPGDLDGSFGTGGTVVSDFGIGREEYGHDVTVDAAGRTVVVGNSEPSSATESSMAIARYTPSGTPDPTFGGGDGLLTLNFGAGTLDAAHAVAVDTNGRIVVAGTSEYSSIALTRLTNSGQLDPSFGGGDGKVTTEIGYYNSTRDVLIDPSGRILVTGGINADLAVLRYTSSGTLDSSFDGDGVAMAGLSGGYGYGIALDSQGRIVVGGEVNESEEADFAAVRFLESGALDPSFSGDGRVVTDINSLGNLDYPSGMALDSQDRPTVVGTTFSPSLSEPLRLAMVRYTSVGVLDPAFGTGGVVLGGDDSDANDIAVDGSGRLLVIGHVHGLPGSENGLLRYLSGGSLDSTFGGGDGIAPAPLQIVEAVTIDPSRRIVAAGSNWSLATNSDFAAARFLSGEAVPPSRTLSVSVSGAGSGSVEGPGISCPSDCTESYASDTSVTLIASPNAGSTFAGWSGGCSGTGNCDLTLGADTAVSATFGVQPSESSNPSATSSTPPPAQTTPAPLARRLKCKKGFRKKKVHGKKRCVRIKKKRRRLAFSARNAFATESNSKKLVTYPVKITIKIKPAELPPDSPWREVEGASNFPVIVIYGQVNSPKPACKRKREIIEVNQPDWAPGPEEDKHTGVFSNATGYWEGEAVPDFLTESIRTGKERIWAKVARKSLGKGRFCAEAKSARLKA